MRHLLSKITTAVERAADMAMWSVIYMVLTPFALISMFGFILPCCAYRYCKHPELSFGQAFRWACTTEEEYHLTDEKPNYFLLWKWGLPLFSMDEYFAVKKIVEGDTCGTDAPNTGTSKPQ